MNAHRWLQAFLALGVWAGFRARLKSANLAKWKEYLALIVATLFALAIIGRLCWMAAIGK